MTKIVLKENSIAYEETNVEEDEAAMDYVKNTLGYSSMPVVVTEQGSFTGFRPDKLQELN